MQSKRKNVDKRKIFLWCAAAGIVLCAVLFCLWHNRTALAEQRVERALSVTVSQPEPRLAQEDNTETGAWITVPGTNIDAPVQQASDNDYYLRRDTAGNADVHGCVFADYACDLNSTSLSRNLVLYGHTFEDGYEGGFKALHNYEQDSFAEEHPYIYLSLPDAALTYRVVSAGVCSAADDRDCIEPNPDDAAFAQILAKAAARNTLDNGEGHDAEMRSLYNVSRNLDLDQAEGLSNFDRRLICVPEHCPKSCSARRSCRYRKYLEEANGRRVTIQICNHNFLLADATHRQEKWPRLLKNYQALVIDEAHKLPEAAAQMYGRRFSVQDGENLCRLLEKSHCTHTAQQLRERLTALQAAFCADEIVNAAVAFCPSNVQNAALLSAQAAFRQAAVTRTAKPLPAWPLHRLRESADVLQLFIEQNSNCILYIQYDSDGKPTLCADCRDLPARLDKALWSVRQAAILTSGTLSAGGNFTHTVQRIGLNNPQTFRAESPFDYKRNCILYFPKRTSTPLDEVEWLSQEIEQLVQVCHGHALVLFTSYDQVGRVQQRLQGLLAYPLLTARRNGQLFVQAFKQLPNAVLFAAGPCWEGVDFPGDRVSLLIIARLPFPVPDPVSDAEKAKYPDLHSYIQAEVIPTMQKKLRQGFGRAIRTETDTCTVAILDPRAAPGGRYHRAALDALPKMNMTQDIKDVEHFIRAVKGAEYFFA